MVLVLVLFINIIAVCIVIVIGNIVIIMYFLYLCDCRPYSHSDIITVLIAIRPLIITIINDNAFLLIIVLLKIMGVSDRAPCVYVPYEKGGVVFRNPAPPSCMELLQPNLPFSLSRQRESPLPTGHLWPSRGTPPFGRQGELPSSLWPSRGTPPLWPSQGNLPL